MQGRYEKSILARSGVVAMGIGYRENQPAFVILVQAGMPMPELPLELEGIPVYVERGDVPVAFNGGQGCSPCHAGIYGSPVPMGVSTGPRTAGFCWVGGGTLGFKACTGKPDYFEGYVTNSHVVAPQANGCPNGTNQSQQQPWQGDVSCTIRPSIGGVLKKTTISTVSNTVDAAFVLSSGSSSSFYIQDIGVPAATAGSPSLNACVRKGGRTTGLTYGRIDLVNTSVNITYCSGFTAPFSGVFRTTADSTCGTCQNPPCGQFAQPGDSGSAIVSTGFSRQIVGLLFAGNVSSGDAYAHPVSSVLGALGVSLDPNDCTGTPL